MAQSGYGDQLPAAARALVPMELYSRRDVWRCPACEALFDFEDLPQFFGSGNLDEQRLDRLSELQASLVRGLLAPVFGGWVPEELVTQAARELPDGLLHAILRHVASRSSAFPALVPALAELLANGNDQGLVPLLLDWAGRRRERLSRVIELLDREGRPLSQFGGVLLKLSRERLAELPV